MKILGLILFGLYVNVATAGGLTPFTSQCIDVASVSQCNEAGADLFDQCGGLDLSKHIVLVGDNAAADVEGTLVIGDSRGTGSNRKGRLFAECGAPDGDAFACEIDPDTSGTFRLYMHQSGFFYRTKPFAEFCTRGTTVVF